MITGHGDDGYLFNTKIRANFSSNVYYDGFPEGLKNHLISCMDKISNYPETNAQSLQLLLAQWHKLSAEQVLITNGATEAFYLIAHALRDKSVTVIIPSFAEYEDACRANNLQIQFLEWDELNEQTSFTTDVVFFGNPNNPTGAIQTQATIQTILQHNPKSTFIIDEAYIDFTKADISMVEVLNQFTNLIIVKSLTKTYAIPGLRLGYILSNPSTIKNILSLKMPWSVNALAVEAGKYIVQNHKKSPLPLEQLLNDAKELIYQLNQIENIIAFPAYTNFFLCKTNIGAAASLKDFLLNEHGLLIRDASNFRSLGSGYFRVATQTADKNELLVNGIRMWMNNF